MFILWSRDPGPEAAGRLSPRRGLLPPCAAPRLSGRRVSVVAACATCYFLSNYFLEQNDANDPERQAERPQLSLQESAETPRPGRWARPPAGAWDRCLGPRQDPAAVLPQRPPRSLGFLKAPHTLLNATRSFSIRNLKLKNKTYVILVKNPNNYHHSIFILRAYLGCTTRCALFNNH